MAVVMNASVVINWSSMNVKKIMIPTNAFLNSSSSGAFSWNCERGYIKRDAECQYIKIPLNGYLSDSSHQGMGV